MREVTSSRPGKSGLPVGIGVFGPSPPEGAPVLGGPGDVLMEETKSPVTEWTNAEMALS